MTGKGPGEKLSTDELTICRVRPDASRSSPYLLAENNVGTLSEVLNVRFEIEWDETEVDDTQEQPGQSAQATV